ncbi:MAG: DNA repair protein RecO [Planctomycetota bacterium]
MSQARQTTALVLRTVEFSETSLIVTLLTEDLGRVSAIAKGARRIKSPFEGSLDLLSVCRIVLIPKAGDVLDILTESKLRRRFRAGTRSLERLYAGYYVAELLRLLIDDDDPHAELFRLTLEILDWIDSPGAKTLPSVGHALLLFDAQALRLLGHAPSIDLCSDCGCNVDLVEIASSNPRNLAFSLTGGGVLCHRCRTRGQNSLMTDPRTLMRLGLLLREPTIQETAPVKLKQEQVGRTIRLTLDGGIVDVPIGGYASLRHLLSRYLQCLLGRAPRMESYLPSGTSVEKEF